MQNESHRTEEVFNLSRDNVNPFYTSSHVKTVVAKIAPSIKVRVREDPACEVYTIQTSGVNHNMRLRWSYGAKQSPSSNEYPAWNNNPSIPQAAQLSPNFSMGYKTTFKNSDGDGDMSWDPTNGGSTGPIDGGLKLTVPHASSPLTLAYNEVYVENIHDIVCDFNGGKHSISRGMILTKYSSISLNGSFDDPNGSSSSVYSMEPRILSEIDPYPSSGAIQGLILTLHG